MDSCGSRVRRQLRVTLCCGKMPSNIFRDPLAPIPYGARSKPIRAAIWLGTEAVQLVGYYLMGLW